jgi:hypothetical protein
MRRTVKSLVAAVLLLGVWAASAKAQGPPLPLPAPKVHPIQVTGPPAQRLNLIILGDGYQWDQQSIFMADVDRNLAVMWATEPFRSYRNYINVYAVEIASIDYGVRCDPDGRKRHANGTIRDTGEREGPIDGKRTALRMIFQNGCADPLSRGTVYGGAPVNCANQTSRRCTRRPCGLMRLSTSTGCSVALANPWGMRVSNSAASPAARTCSRPPSASRSCPLNT